MGMVGDSIRGYLNTNAKFAPISALMMMISAETSTSIRKLILSPFLMTENPVPQKTEVDRIPHHQYYIMGKQQRMIRTRGKINAGNFFSSSHRLLLAK